MKIILQIFCVGALGIPFLDAGTVQSLLGENIFMTTEEYVKNNLKRRDEVRTNPDNMIVSQDPRIQGRFVSPTQYTEGQTSPYKFTEANQYQFFWGGYYTYGNDKAGDYEIIGNNMVLKPFYRFDGVTESAKTVEFSSLKMKFTMEGTTIEYSFNGELLAAGQMAKCNYCSKLGKECTEPSGSKLETWRGWHYKSIIEGHLNSVADREWREEYAKRKAEWEKESQKVKKQINNLLDNADSPENNRKKSEFDKHYLTRPKGSSGTNRSPRKTRSIQ